MTAKKAQSKAAKKAKAPSDPPAPFAVEMWPADRPRPYERNVKAHTEQAVRRLADVIVRVGVLVPIVVDEAGVIAKGHRTLLACRLLGHREVPVHVARGVPDAELRAWRIADNKLPEDSPWDLAALKAEVADLKAAGLDLAATGFGARELEDLGDLDLGAPGGGGGPGREYTAEDADKARVECPQCGERFYP